jgi:hypothetical protein
VSRSAFRFGSLRIAFAICALGLSVADASGAELKPALRLRLAWRVDPDSREGGYWILKSLPDPEQDVIAEDKTLRADLAKAVAALRADSANTSAEWNLKRGDRHDFGAALKEQMRANYANFYLYPPRHETDAPEIQTVSVYYEPRIAAHKAIEIAVIVRGSGAIAQRPVSTTIGNLAAHGVAEFGGLSEEDRATKVLIAADDKQPARAAWAESHDHMLAFAIAAYAFQSALRHDLRSNQPAGNERQGAAVKSGAGALVSDDIETKVHELFALPGEWQPIPAAETERNAAQSEADATSPWKIRIVLQAVEDVRFVIKGSRIEGELESLEAHPRCQRRIAQLEDRVLREQRERFDRLRGRLITAEEFEALTDPITREIDGQEKVVAAAVTTDARAIVFSAYFQPRIVDVEAGLGYSTDKSFNGSASLSARNLIKDESLLKLSFVAGLEEREGDLSYALPYFISRDHAASSSLDLTASYGKDDDLKLGAPERGGFDEELFQASVRNTFRYTKEHLSENVQTKPAPQEVPPGRAFSTVLTAGVGFSNTRLDAPPALRAEVQDGEVFYLALDLRQSWRWKQRVAAEAGFGEARVLWTVKAKKGLELGPGDFDYFAGNTTVTGNVYFGSRSSRDFRLRLSVGGALVTGNSPIFEEFRLGSDGVVRGLEEGERLARGAVYETLQLGVAIKRLWPGGSETMGFDLKNVYLSVFFDHGFITRRGSREPQNGGSRSLEAVGASLEMALPSETLQGSLELGYAWSPDSIHKHGRVFTSVRLDFY